MRPPIGQVMSNNELEGGLMVDPRSDGTAHETYDT